MNCLSGQDDFFQTSNQPISLQHLSQPYNKLCYFPKTRTPGGSCMKGEQHFPPASDSSNFRKCLIYWYKPDLSSLFLRYNFFRFVNYELDICSCIAFEAFLRRLKKNHYPVDSAIQLSQLGTRRAKHILMTSLAVLKQPFSTSVAGLLRVVYLLKFSLFRLVLRWLLRVLS